MFITFDDGPHPEITPAALDILDQYQASATFFCVGQNVERYPETYHEILRRKHSTGNHTFNHLNAWKVPKEEYFQNVDKCTQYVDSHLFRPPYGRIGLKHIRHLKRNYSIVMWSVLSLDFDPRVTPEKCLDNCLRYMKAGSILIFHDSQKASSNMLYALPRFIEYFKSKGYTFPALTNDQLTTR